MSDPTHPKAVHPKRKFNKNIANIFLCCLKKAMRVGKKYAANIKIAIRNSSGVNSCSRIDGTLLSKIEGNKRGHQSFTPNIAQPKFINQKSSGGL